MVRWLTWCALYLLGYLLTLPCLADTAADPDVHHVTESIATRAAARLERQFLLLNVTPQCLVDLNEFWPDGLKTVTLKTDGIAVAADEKLTTEFAKLIRVLEQPNLHESFPVRVMVAERSLADVIQECVRFDYVEPMQSHGAYLADETTAKSALASMRADSVAVRPLPDINVNAVLVGRAAADAPLVITSKSPLLARRWTPALDAPGLTVSHPISGPITPNTVLLVEGTMHDGSTTTPVTIFLRPKPGDEEDTAFPVVEEISGETNAIVAMLELKYFDPVDVAARCDPAQIAERDPSPSDKTRALSKYIPDGVQMIAAVPDRHALLVKSTCREGIAQLSSFLKMLDQPIKRIKIEVKLLHAHRTPPASEESNTISVQHNRRQEENQPKAARTIHFFPDFQTYLNTMKLPNDAIIFEQEIIVTEHGSGEIVVPENSDVSALSFSEVLILPGNSVTLDIGCIRTNGAQDRMRFRLRAAQVENFSEIAPEGEGESARNLDMLLRLTVLPPEGEEEESMITIPSLF